MDHTEMSNAIIRALRYEISMLNEERDELLNKLNDSNILSNSLAVCLKMSVDGKLSKEEYEECLLVYQIWSDRHETKEDM